MEDKKAYLPIISPGGQEKWYFKTAVLVTALLCVGPFALPLLWFNPRFSMKMKVAVSVIVIILTYYLTILTANSLKTIMNYYKQFGGI